MCVFFLSDLILNELHFNTQRIIWHVPWGLRRSDGPTCVRVLGTNFFHRVVGFGCFPYGSSINKDPSYTMFDNMDAGHVLLSFGFELARGLQF